MSERHHFYNKLWSPTESLQNHVFHQADLIFRSTEPLPSASCLLTLPLFLRRTVKSGESCEDGAQWRCSPSYSSPSSVWQCPAHSAGAGSAACVSSTAMLSSGESSDLQLNSLTSVHVWCWKLRQERRWRDSRTGPRHWRLRSLWCLPEGSL